MARRVLLAIGLVVCLGLPSAWRPAQEWRAPRRALWTRDTTSDSPCVVSLPASPGAGPIDYLPDATDALHVDFTHTVGPLGTYFMPEVNGAGGALFDFDNDGDLDLLFVNSARSPQARGEFPPGTRLGNRLYRQEADGKFVDVTIGSGLEGGGYAVGCAVGDIDNDGHLDVYVTHYGPDKLYRNNGNGTFSDVTQAAGIDDHDYGTCAAFVDYDRDGWLDLIVVNYVHDPIHELTIACASIYGRNSYCGPHKFVKTVNRLFHNEGPEVGRPTVRYRDVTAATGLSDAPNAGFGVICADFNNDGRPDIYIANDMAPKQLWINQAGDRFVDEAALRGVAVSGQGLAQGSMGVALGDVDGDGHFDLAVTNLFSEMTTLYGNDGAGTFRDRTRELGLAKPTLRHTGWGVALVDLDHDGDLDLAQVNGLVVPCHSAFLPHGEDIFKLVSETISDPAKFWREYADDNVLLLNAGSGGFVDESERAATFAKTGSSARALIWGDIDNDGDIDLVVTNCGERARVYRNELPKSGHWLMVRAVDPQLHRDAYGAEITVAAGGRKFRRVVNPASSYLASNDVRAHFGLGLAIRYDEITVSWPDGLVEQFDGGEIDRRLVVQRGTGRPVAEEARP